MNAILKIIDDALQQLEAVPPPGLVVLFAARVSDKIMADVMATRARRDAIANQAIELAMEQWPAQWPAWRKGRCVLPTHELEDMRDVVRLLLSASPSAVPEG